MKVFPAGLGGAVVPGPVGCIGTPPLPVDMDPPGPPVHPGASGRPILPVQPNAHIDRPAETNHPQVASLVTPLCRRKPIVSSMHPRFNKPGELAHDTAPFPGRLVCATTDLDAPCARDP